jgi:hypothetical protein
MNMGMARLTSQRLARNSVWPAKPMPRSMKASFEIGAVVIPRTFPSMASLLASRTAAPAARPVVLEWDPGTSRFMSAPKASIR